MKTKLILLLTTLTTVLAACNKTSNGTAADASASAASNSLSVTPMITTPAAGQTITISVSGGSGVYTSMTASQGSAPIQQSTNTWTYAVPTSFSLPQVTFTAMDSAGASGTGFIAIQGTSTGTTVTTASASCAGTYTATFNTLNGQLYIVQNVNNQIGGYVYFSQSGYYQPISGTCSYVSGAASGTISFQELSSKQTYSATITNSGGQLVIRGTIAGNIPFQAYSSGTIAAPTTESVACSGTYNGAFGPNQGTLTLVHNGSGTMAGSLVIAAGGTTNYYAITGTCGASITLRNVTTGSNYTGSFNGSTMGGTYTLTNGTPYTWSVSK